MTVKAQQGSTPIDLKSILEQISTTNKIKFNYIDEEIIIYKIIPPLDTAPLEQKSVT